MILDEIKRRTVENVFAHRSACELQLNNLDHHETIRPWWCMNCGHGSCCSQSAPHPGECYGCLECLHGLDVATDSVF